PVDPRFTRTSSVAYHLVQTRAASDIAFLGGIINYIVKNDRINKEYLANYTNASLIIKEGFKLPDDGFFSGWENGKYTNISTWNYEEGGDLTPKDAAAFAATASTLVKPPAPPAAKGAAAHAAPASKPAKVVKPAAAAAAGAPASAPPPTLPPNVAYDLSLQHPRCVYQLLKKQYEKYTPENVSKITGADKDK